MYIYIYIYQTRRHYSFFDNKPLVAYLRDKKNNRKVISILFCPIVVLALFILT